MRTKRCVSVCLLLCLFTPSLKASSPAAIPVGIDDGSPSSITADFYCKVLEVERANSKLVLLELESETSHEVVLDDSVKLRARSRRDFDGRKKLGLADLRAGQEIKIRVLLTDGSIRRITVVKQALG